MAERTNACGALRVADPAYRLTAAVPPSMTYLEIRPPAQILTARLVLRAWRPEDAPHLKRAIDSSLEHLRPWMPWAWDEPSPLEEMAARLARFADNFATGKDWLYGIFTPDERTVIGGTGLHPRIGPGGVEIGYWIAAQQTRKAYATEVARALTTAAFALPEIERVEIRCDPRNVASASLPPRLGYRQIEASAAASAAPAGGSRETMVWRLTRAEFAAQAAGT
jgi:RimJ/RimL family protein N-acetyltransferase